VADQTREKVGEAQERAVARGATPWARVQLGYRRRPNGALEVDQDTAPIVRRVYEMRLEGASLMQIRKMLREHGVERSHRGVQEMLKSRVYLGEVHFGKLHNLEAHEPIFKTELERKLWYDVEALHVKRGPRPKSTRLLSRLDVLRCGSCGARMVAMKLPRQRDYPIYRCPSTSDCPKHMTISAQIVEDAVVVEVKRLLDGLKGTASGESGVLKAQEDLERAQEALEQGIRVLAGLESEPVAIERLRELRDARDRARDHHQELASRRDASTVAVTMADWDQLTLDEQRQLIRIVVERVTVAPGRGPERITIEPRA
jgi:hypothetical protein